MHGLKGTGRAAVTATTLAVGGWQLGALKTAAGGTSGENGFHAVSAFLDKLATYIIWLAVPAGALGLIAGGAMLIGGDQNGASVLAKVAVGFGIVLLSKAILA